MTVKILVIIAVIMVFLLCIKMKTKRQKFSVLVGFVVSIMSFFAFLALIFSAQRSILWLLLFVVYISLIVFLILWNIIKTKAVYLILSVPAVSILSALTVMMYYNYIHKIRLFADYG
jgi:hypothetical protein